MSREPLMDLFSRFSKLISVIIGDDSFDEAQSQSQYKPKPISASTVKASHSRSNTQGTSKSIHDVAASSASAIASRADAAAAAMAEAYEKRRKQQAEAQAQSQDKDSDKSTPDAASESSSASAVSTSTASDTSTVSYDSATTAATVTAAANTALTAASDTATVSSHTQPETTDTISASQSSGNADNAAVAALTASSSADTATEQSTVRDSNTESTDTVTSASSHEATSSSEEPVSAVSDDVSNALSGSGVAATATTTTTATDSDRASESVAVSAVGVSAEGPEDTAASASIAATSAGNNTVADSGVAVNVSAGSRDAIAVETAAGNTDATEAAGGGDSTRAGDSVTAVEDHDIDAESVYEDTPQEITFLEEDEDILLSPVEQKILGYFYQEQAALQDLRTTLAEHLIALVGSKCVEDFLPASYSAQEHDAHDSNTDSADSASAANADHEDAAALSADGLGLGVAFFEHLEPRYIELIANQLSEFQQQQRNIPSSVPWDKLYITITRKSLSGLYDNDLLPDYSWLVPDEQNATYWRNNNPDGKLNLCAISSGETEDTLGNLRQRIISSDSLKLKLTTADVLPQLLQYLDYLQRSKDDVFHSPLMLEFTQLLDEPRLADLSMVLDRLRETLSLKPINLCEYLAEVIVRYSLSHELIESMGQAVSVLHYPSDSFLFVSNSKANSKKLTKKACTDALNNMLKNRPSLLESASIGISLDSFELEQLIDNFNSLYVGASEADAERKAANAAGAASAANASAAGTNAAGAASTGEEATAEAEDVSPEPPLKTWEAALCKEYLRAVWQSSEQGNNEARDAAFKMLCSIEWNAKLERFFSKEKSKSKKPNLYVRTINMFNSNLTADEALSPEEYAVIELTKTKINALTSDERNQLNEFYNSRRSIFSRDNAIAKDWEKLIYFKDVFAEPDFLYSLSSAMLNLYNADPQAHRRLAKVELCLDVTKKDLLRLNFNVMAYFSLRYGAFLSHLGEILNQRFSVCINGQMSPDEPNPVLNFPAFFAFWQEQQEDTRRKGPCFEVKDKNTTLNFKLTP